VSIIRPDVLLAVLASQDLCKQFVTPDMVSLGEDPVFRVRKATALNLYNIARVVGESDRVDRLLPTFIRLTKDDMYR
jgi:serine/threonine-protein phosphatase 4 regulatory subunit 1